MLNKLAKAHELFCNALLAIAIITIAIIPFAAHWN